MPGIVTRVTWFEQDTGGSKIVVSEFRWKPSDPLAMTIIFLQQEDTEWVFSYDLLRDVIQGTSWTAGEGDVRFAKTLSSAGEQLTLRLSSPFGTANLRCDIHAPQEFVQIVQAAKPHTFTTDIDSALARLLDGNYE